MSRSVKKVLWDLVVALAVTGIAYGTWEMIEAGGLWVGVPLAILTVIFGYLAFEMVYLLWRHK